MSERGPRVSAFVPAFNAAPWIRRAIDSLVTQTYRDIEIILVDDGSTDDTPSIIRAAAERDERIRFAVLDHAGVSAAANRAIAMAKGEYIARLDADDIALSDRFARQVAWLDEHPNVAALGGAMVIIDAEERKQRMAHYVTAPADVQKAVLGYSPLAHPTTMMRRSIILGVGGYRSTFDTAEDYDLWLRISEIAGLASLPEVLTYYRSHPQQVSVTATRRQAGLAMLAQAAAAIRRSGQPDPIPAGLIATADSIKTLGLDRSNADRIAAALQPV